MILFDLDGVLVDSRAAISGSLNAALTELGLPAQPERALHAFIGPPLHGVFAALLPRLGGSVDLVDDAVAAYRERYRTLSLTDTVLAPEIGSLLESLTAHRLAVVTSKPTAFAEPILETLQIRRHFECVVGPALHARNEPKRETLGRGLRALELEGPKTEPRPVMIGDRHHDIDAARAHGLPSVGVTWGIGDAEELHRAGATHVADSPAELLEWLTG